MAKQASQNNWAVAEVELSQPHTNLLDYLSAADVGERESSRAQMRGCMQDFFGRLPRAERKMQ